MRILYCNKYNFPFSGTEIYLFEVMELMRQHGHEVALFSMADPRGAPTPYDHHFVPNIDFKSNSGAWQKVQSALHAMYSSEARRRIRAMIREFRPDIAHVRNIYHHLSPSILWELKAQGVPILYHINDFKLLCPSYNLVSQGEACERCKGGAFWQVVRAPCYPGTTARIALAAEAYAHDWLGSYRRCIDLFLAPSRFVRDKFVEHGWDGEKFEVLPHFQRVAESIEDEECCASTRASSVQSSNVRHGVNSTDASVLYFGRLSAEKGIRDLLQTMARLPQIKLMIAGDGPHHAELMGLADSLGLANVEFVGHVSGSALQDLITRSRFTVLPSHAYETFGKSILESYAQGRAVVASDMGSRRELVRDGETGLLYPPGNVARLVEAIRTLDEYPELARTMGRNGWELARREYTAESHYEKLLHLYQRLVAKRASRKNILIQTAQQPPWNRRLLSLAKSRCGDPDASQQISPLRIAFIGGRGVVSKYSGIETYYEEVGRELAGRGHEVTVYCRSYFTPNISEYHGMRVVRLPTIRSKHWETVVHTLLSTLHALTREYDIVHYHALGPSLFSFIPRLFGKKTVVTVQGLDWQRKKWGRFASAVLRLGERASVHFPNATMVVSRTLQDRYLELHGRQTFYVPNAGVLRKRQKARQISEWGLEPGKYILFLGRFSPEKGCHLLVEAHQRLETEVKLVMAGASSYCDSYSKQLRSCASERIKVLDWVSGEVLDELLTNAMLFVLPSDLEGLSLALLDAMGAGLCVLASDVPENREVVDGAGFTFIKGDVTDLCRQLQFLIANPAARAAAADAAKNKILQSYQWTNIASDIEAVYDRVLSRKPAVRPQASSSATTEILGRKVG